MKKIWITIGLSKRKRLPCFRFMGISYIIPPFRKWLRNRKLLNEYNDEGLYFFNDGTVLKTRTFDTTFVKDEFFIHGYNRLDVRGKVVLDIGAACGGTAYYFLKRGARKVIAVEPDLESFELLKENIRTNRWEDKVIPVNSGFELEQLDAGDVVKMDCEGCESLLLSLKNINKQIIVEVHSREMLDKIFERFGGKYWRFHGDLWMLVLSPREELVLA